MENYSWEELSKLYDACLSLSDPEREIFLSENTEGKPELRSRIKEMLSQTKESEGYFKDLMKDIAEGFGANMPDLAKPGDIVKNYRIIEKIGAGGSSQVFVAERVDGQFDKKVAVKIFKKKGLGTFDDKSENEKQFLASLSHPSIAHIFDGGTLENGHPYIIMELVEGKTLQVYLKERNLTQKECLNIFSEVCSSVREAHNNLILHLDIKPGNLVVDKSQRIKLLDFGISQSLKQNMSDNTFSKLTFNFAAPEQLQGRILSVQTDIYQLGLLLYYLLSRGQILEGQEQTNLFLNGNDSKFIPSEELLSIIKKCLQSKPENRYQSVDQLLIDIYNYLQNYPVSTFSKSRFYIARKYVQRNSVATLLLSLVFLSLIGGTIVSLRQAQIANAEKEKAEKTAEFIKDLFISTSPLAEGENYKDLSVFDFLEIKKTLLFNEKSITVENKWELLNLLFETYINLPEADQAAEVASNMINLAIEEDNSLWILMSTHKKALAHSMSYNFEIADSLYNNVYMNMGELMEYNKQYAIQALSDIGLNFILQRNFDSAEFYLNEAISLPNQIQEEDLVIISTAYHYYSQVKRGLGEVDTALFYATKALEYKVQKYGLSDLRISSDLSDRAAIYADMKRYSDAEADLLNAIKIDLSVLDSSGVTVVMKLANYATLLSYQKKYNKAAELTEHLLKLRKERYGIYSFDNAFLCLNLTKYYSALNKYDLVDKNTSMGLQILDSLKGYPPYIKGLFLLSKSLVEIKGQKPKEALNHLEESQYLLTPLLNTPNNVYQEIIDYRRGGAFLQQGQIQEGEELINNAITRLKDKEGDNDIFIKEAEGYLNYLKTNSFTN
ncbi:hypothetical protein GCM10011506_27650 [Marivirga lumbricoides]|uniref:Protein kinase domain-containing protein n=1 Tax=Marivirga lumbricoides TaxID=1046115 RepID=A0ABQ1MKH3_9BACT|nr:hypothetical protein GCM10011506_27650 [Marivirga lumbricoides]